jgi:very-short-patch-repair endonuclease
VLTLAQASARLTPKAVRWRLASGRWQRACRGVLVAHSGPVPPPARLWIAVFAAGPGAALAGLTAAAVGGLHGYESSVLQVVVPPGREVTRLAGLAVHRSALDRSDLHPTGQPTRTRLARSLVDAARWAPTDDRACAILAAGVQQRLVRPGELSAVLARLPTARRRRLLRATIGDLAGGAQSLAELDLVRLCQRHRLPRPKQQVERRDARGRRRWLDASWPEWGIHVEIDGAAHVDVDTWWADLRRQNEVWVRGDRLLRFPAYVLRRDPEAVVKQLRAALRAAGWPGSVGVPAPAGAVTPTDPA